MKDSQGNEIKVGDVLVSSQVPEERLHLATNITVVAIDGDVATLREGEPGRLALNGREFCLNAKSMAISCWVAAARKPKGGE